MIERLWYKVEWQKQFNTYSAWLDLIFWKKMYVRVCVKIYDIHVKKKIQLFLNSIFKHIAHYAFFFYCRFFCSQ